MHEFVVSKDTPPASFKAMNVAARKRWAGGYIKPLLSRLRVLSQSLGETTLLVSNYECPIFEY